MNPLTHRWGLLAVALALIALCGTLILVLVPAPHPLGSDMAGNQATTTPMGGTATSTSGGPDAGTTTPQGADLSDVIVVTSPAPGATIGAGSGTSTITIIGKARGSFYFEASFPVSIVDWDGRIIAEGHAEAQGDWMTSDFVPFSATLTYTEPEGSNKRGTLILHNDNPSGDPARDKALEIPIMFK